MSHREEELPLQMTENSYQNIMIFFILNTHKASRMDCLSLIASQGVTVSSALLWLLTGRHFWEKSTKENSSSSWQVGLFTNYLFPSIRHTREFTCICSTMLCCSLLSLRFPAVHLIKYFFIMSWKNVTNAVNFKYYATMLADRHLKLSLGRK